MTTVSPLAGDGIAGAIARRAVDLAHDGSLSVDDVSEHLQRLARGNREALEEALDALAPLADSRADVCCAALLVRRAIDLLPRR